jgi:hypothetical protein
VRPVVLGVVLLLSVGCTACGANLVPRPRCSGGATQPLTRELVLRELRRSGFAVNATTGGQDCAFADAALAYSISNAPEDSDAYNRIQKQQGTVFCLLYRHAVFDAALAGDLHEHAASPMFHGRKAHFWLTNLECRLYAGEQRQDQQVQALHAAMKRIAAQLPSVSRVGR